MEQYRVSLSKAARHDLDGIANYIATRFFAPITASKKVKSIRETIKKKLSFMPQKYRLVNNQYLASKGYRSMTMKNHTAFFIINERRKVVTVRRIIYARRDWARVLSGEIQ